MAAVVAVIQLVLFVIVLFDLLAVKKLLGELIYETKRTNDLLAGPAPAVAPQPATTGLPPAAPERAPVARSITRPPWEK